MKIIGVTGGVGAGKSEILSYLKNEYHAYILQADEVANKLKQPGESCYEAVAALFGKDILAPDGRIDNRRMAERVFADKEKRMQVNAVIHPAVRRYILDQIEKQQKAGTEIFVLEAALLIEQHYDEVVDEMWYIDTSEEVRRQRLRDNRGYPDEKITAIMKSQMSAEAFRQGADFVIDNSGKLEDTKKQIDQKMREQ